jgi:hypothetical protein
MGEPAAKLVLGWARALRQLVDLLCEPLGRVWTCFCFKGARDGAACCSAGCSVLSMGWDPERARVAASVLSIPRSSSRLSPSTWLRPAPAPCDP